MKRFHFTRSATVIVVGVMAIVVVGCGETEVAETAAKPTVNDSNAATESDGDFSPYVDQDGKISLPAGYKQKWAHLGSWAVAKKEGETIHEMHDVYTQPETIAAYNKTGEFPDGTVLVKEVHRTKTDELNTGHASWSTDIKPELFTDRFRIAI